MDTLNISKPLVYLLGRHANRTPMSYPVYKALFERYFEYTDVIDKADFVVMGYEVAIREFAADIARAQESNPSQRLVVLSEEPYWDLVLAGQVFDKYNRMHIGGSAFDYVSLNHTNTDTFNFEHFPYFITTDNAFFDRYHMLYRRNSGYSNDDILACWRQATYQGAFIAEKRAEERFDVSSDKYHVKGLMYFRTQVMERFLKEGYLVQGKGWFDNVRRQSIPDWHLDKLAMLDQKCFLISALENTCQQHYITEKLFDAYACLGFPVVYSEQPHRLYDLVPKEAVLELGGLGVDQAAGKISDLTVTDVNLKAYREALSVLANKFTRTELLSEERQRVVHNVVTELYALF